MICTIRLMLSFLYLILLENQYLTLILDHVLKKLTLAFKWSLVPLMALAKNTPSSLLVVALMSASLADPRRNWMPFKRRSRKALPTLKLASLLSIWLTPMKPLGLNSLLRLLT